MSGDEVWIISCSSRDCDRTWVQQRMSFGVLNMTTVNGPAQRRWLKPRLSPNIFLLVASYLCVEAAYDDRWPGKMITNFEAASCMFFLLSWLLPLVAIVTGSYLFFRHRALQYALEVGVAIWLLVRALNLIGKAG
jgi:hypothetical protein